MERKPREITVFELELLEGGGRDFLLRIRCSKGTYVRTLCHDIGAALGCGGCMSSLRRTKAGRFTLADSVKLAELTASAEPGAYLLPVDTLFADLPALTLTAAQVKPCRNGAAIPMGNPGREMCIRDRVCTAGRAAVPEYGGTQPGSY